MYRRGTFNKMIILVGLDNMVEWSIVILSATVGGVLGALMVYVLGLHVAISRIAALEGDLARLKGQVWGQDGRAKQVKTGADTEAAIAEVFMAIQGGKDPKEAIMEIAQKYPSVTSTLLKKYVKI